MASDFTGFGDLLGAQGQPHSIDAGASLSDSEAGTLPALDPHLDATDSVAIDDVLPPLDLTVTEIDPDHQGESYPGGPPGDYKFASLSASESAVMPPPGWERFRPAPTPPSSATVPADPYVLDCEPGQQRIRVICTSGVLTRVSIYNDNGINILPVYTAENIGTGQTAPPDKSYCGDFTRVNVEYQKEHATFRFFTNTQLFARRPA